MLISTTKDYITFHLDYNELPDKKKVIDEINALEENDYMWGGGKPTFLQMYMFLKDHGLFISFSVKDGGEQIYDFLSSFDYSNEQAVIVSCWMERNNINDLDLHRRILLRGDTLWWK